MGLTLQIRTRSVAGLTGWVAIGMWPGAGWRVASNPCSCETVWALPVRAAATTYILGMDTKKPEETRPA